MTQSALSHAPGHRFSPHARRTIVKTIGAHGARPAPLPSPRPRPHRRRRRPTHADTPMSLKRPRSDDPPNQVRARHRARRTAKYSNSTPSHHGSHCWLPSKPTPTPTHSPPTETQVTPHKTRIGKASGPGPYTAVVPREGLARPQQQHSCPQKPEERRAGSW